MNLITEIKFALTDSNANITNILRKAKILAYQLKIDNFKEWIKNELEGYPNLEQLPTYRKFIGQNFGTFAGPYNSMVKNITIPTYNLPTSVKEFAEKLNFTNSVGNLLGMLKMKSEQLVHKWPQEALILAREATKLEGGYILVDAWQPISKNMIEGIIDNVKNKLLSFLLDLEESNIAIENNSLKSEERSHIRNLFNVTIYGSNNVVTSGENINQKIKNIKKNDIESLFKYLRDYNVPEEDLQELEVAIQQDAVVPHKGFGNKVKEWIGNMATKASLGLWKVTSSTTIALLIEALKQFFGL